MSERRTVTVTLFTSDRDGDDSKVPDRLLGIPAWIAGFIEQIPEEFRESAVFEFGSDGDYDSPHEQISIWYKRPETDAEIAEREATALQYERRREAEERASYEALRRKFEKAKTP
jgi:hypothetical protein